MMDEAMVSLDGDVHGWRGTVELLDTEVHPLVV